MARWQEFGLWGQTDPNLNQNPTFQWLCEFENIDLTFPRLVFLLSKVETIPISGYSEASVGWCFIIPKL